MELALVLIKLAFFSSVYFVLAVTSIVSSSDRAENCMTAFYCFQTVVLLHPFLFLHSTRISHFEEEVQQKCVWPSAGHLVIV